MTVQLHTSAEFSRPLVLDAVGLEDLVMEIEATDRERSALAERFDLLALARLWAKLRIRRREEASLLLVGCRIEAEVTQACIVTLEPVTSRLVESVEWRYSLDGRAAEADAELSSGSREILVDAEMEDPPEVVGPEGIDLGEAVAQQLSVALDPYPRAAGASVADLDWADLDAADRGTGAFEALEVLRRKP